MEAPHNESGNLLLQEVIESVPHTLVVYKAESFGGGACFAVEVMTAS